MRIVIVEDEVRIRDGLRYLLSQMGMQYQIVAEASNGSQGLEKVLELKPDLVITDVQMEDMDGLQMLERISQQHVQIKAVILSAFSEFGYAQQAVRLGVCEYLLKPVNVGDFIRCIQRVESQIRRASESLNRNMLAKIAEDLLESRIEWNDALAQLLKTRYNIDDSTSVLIIAAYLGNDDIHLSQIYDILNQYLDQQQLWTGLAIKSPAEKSVYLMLAGRNITEKSSINICQTLLRNRDLLMYCSIGFIIGEGFIHLKDNCCLLQSVMDWNIATGEHRVISYSKVHLIKSVHFQYPIEYEQLLRNALCAGDLQKTEQYVRDFFGALWRNPEQFCMAKEAKEFAARMILTQINTAKELGLLAMPILEQHVLMDRVKWARTKTELIAITVSLCEKLLFQKPDRLNDNATIKRAVSMIHDFYCDGITQEEIALKLGMTQEYLSTLFHKVMGVSFSIYIKNYRMQKAKEMLIGSTMKQSEIARQLGYMDVKYFSKVFKTSTGMLPTEYRRMNK